MRFSDFFSASLSSLFFNVFFLFFLLFLQKTRDSYRDVMENIRFTECWFCVALGKSEKKERVKIKKSFSFISVTYLLIEQLGLLTQNNEKGKKNEKIKVKNGKKVTFCFWRCFVTSLHHDDIEVGWARWRCFWIDKFIIIMARQ